jgi:probable HAF family extracellular repeat protein
MKDAGQIIQTTPFRANTMRTRLTVAMLLFFPAVGSSPAAAQPTYTVTDLGIFPTGTRSEATRINELGHVAGGSDKNEAFYTQAVLWRDGEMLDLTGSGISGAVANSLNDANQVVGYSDEFMLNAFLWADGVLTELPVPVDCCSEAHDINAPGQIVGRASIVNLGSSHAVLWEGGVMTDLGTLGGSSSQAYAINDAGQVVGMSGVSASVHRAFLWENGQMIDLGTLGGEDSQARDINAHGHVVGFANNQEDRTRAFVWRNNQMINLGTLPASFAASYAYGINDDDLIVGASYGDGFTGLHATLWTNDQPVDLNDLIDPASGWELREATGINNAGMIVGAGAKDGQTRAFLLEPPAPPPPPPPPPPPQVPAASTWGFIATSLLVLTTAVLAISFRKTGWPKSPEGPGVTI